MGPGDLVRVSFSSDLKMKSPHSRYHGRVGIVTKFAWRGHIPVWWVMLEDGKCQGFEELHLVEVK